MQLSQYTLAICKEADDGPYHILTGEEAIEFNCVEKPDLVFHTEQAAFDWCINNREFIEKHYDINDVTILEMAYRKVRNPFATEA